MAHIHYTEGQVNSRLYGCLSRMPPLANFKDFSSHAIAVLEALGYAVKREVLVDNRGDGYRGFVDCVAIRDNEIVAIEFDRKSPRKKSIFKVRQVKATARIIVCREKPDLELL